MYKALENSLYVKEPDRYLLVRKRANAFNSNYTGSNIIQDDIFHILENYVSQQEKELELLRYPLGDDDFCACTFIRSGSVFVLINSSMPLSKQIFAGAHGLYHLYNYFEEYDLNYQQHPSILDSATMDDDTTRTEDMEANAFAGLILAPTRSLQEQMDIFHVHKENIRLKEILGLMEIYAIPYKATVLRLFEDGIIDKEKARHLFEISEHEIMAQCELTGRAQRWMRNTETDVAFGTLKEKMEIAVRLDAVDEGRYATDKERIKQLIATVTNRY